MDHPAASHLTTTRSWPVGEMDLSGVSTNKEELWSGRWQTLIEAQSPRYTLTLITFYQADKMELFVSGPDLTGNFWFNLTVSIYNYPFSNLSLSTDQKKDIVSLIPDLNQPHLIHSCSMDRTISTYDLKQEKRMNGHQTQNGSLYGMSQRKDNEFELVTCGQGAPIFFWDCDES